MALCVVLTVRIANDLQDGFHVEIPDPAIESAAVPALAGQLPRSDRERILARNLFDLSEFAPPEPAVPVQEEVAPTELPLGLLGTSASPRADLSWAAVWDAENKERLVVQEGDAVANGLATVARIERGRVLFSEDGAIRELELDGDGEYLPAKRPTTQKRRAARKNNRRRRSRR